MSNKSLFAQKEEVLNAAGGLAVKMNPKHLLANLSCTGTFNGTFYASADKVLAMAKEAALYLKNDPEFLAKVAVYSRTKGNMKDMPTFLMVVLADADPKLFLKVFPIVINNGKMLRNFVQIAMSGATGRKFNISAGCVRKAIQNWFNNASSHAVFNASVGNDPRLSDIIKLAHPTPNTKEKAALFAYILGNKYNKETNTYQQFRYSVHGDKTSPKVLVAEHNFNNLPDFVRKYEHYKLYREGEIPNIDFRFLDSMGLKDSEWKQIALNAPYNMVLMNLNTFARHGVFAGDKEVTQGIANFLSNPDAIHKAKIFPYKLMMAAKSIGDNYHSAWGKEKVAVPEEIRKALSLAMEIATDNVPTIDGKVVVFVDVSGSMRHAITGNASSPSQVRCLDAAALFAAALLRKNRNAQVIAFSDEVHTDIKLDPKDSIEVNANKLADYHGGGTNCSVGLAKLNAENVNADAVIYISDYESFLDKSYDGKSPGLYNEWEKFVARNPEARLIAMDLTPRQDAQVRNSKQILQVGSFSDQVFNVVNSFLLFGNDPDYWVKIIEKTDIGKKIDTENISDDFI